MAAFRQWILDRFGLSRHRAGQSQPTEQQRPESQVESRTHKLHGVLPFANKSFQNGQSAINLWTPGTAASGGASSLTIACIPCRAAVFPGNLHNSPVPRRL